MSASFSDSQSNSKQKFILEGQYGNLKELRVTLSTVTQLENDYASLLGGVDADLGDEQAERDFEELYNKVAYVVTGVDTRPK